ncbi:MAG TPA: rhodanese-like domain-containing protein, partial [Gemmatimonadales bacterium]
NWAFGVEDEEEFVRLVLAGQPEPPAYFGRMKTVNRDGPRVLGRLPSPPALPPDRVEPVLAAGALVIDLRPAADYAAGHIPGTVSLPLTRGFTTYAGSVLPYDRELYLLAAESSGGPAAEAARDLALIGLDHVRGRFGPDALERWVAAGGALERIETVTAREAAGLAEQGAAILDVRTQAEWDDGHLPGAEHVPLGTVAERAGQLPAGRTLVVHCQGGSRSAIAASLLAARGTGRVVNLAGGYAEWTASGLPVERTWAGGLADMVVGPARGPKRKGVSR